MSSVQRRNQRGFGWKKYEICKGYVDFQVQKNYQNGGLIWRLELKRKVRTDDINSLL